MEFWDGNSTSSFFTPACFPAEAAAPLVKSSCPVLPVSHTPNKPPTMPPKRVKKVMTMPINVIFGHLQVRTHMWLCRDVSSLTHNLCSRARFAPNALDVPLFIGRCERVGRYAVLFGCSAAFISWPLPFLAHLVAILNHRDTQADPLPSHLPSPFILSAKEAGKDMAL